MSDEFLDAVRDCLRATEGAVGVEVTFKRSTVAELVARLDRYERHTEPCDVMTRLKPMVDTANGIAAQLKLVDGRAYALATTIEALWTELRLTHSRLNHGAVGDVVDEKLLTSAKALAKTLSLADNGTDRRAGRTITELLEKIDWLQGMVSMFSDKMPAWKDGKPEDYDDWLRSLTPVDRRLAFYQWIGEMAVTELLADLREGVRDDPRPPEHRHYTQDEVYELLDAVRGTKGVAVDPYPSVLPRGKHMCDVQWHTHTDGMGYLPSCRLDDDE